MDPPKSDAPKLPDMVMCGDHPSFTKTELNAKTDARMDEKDKEKAKEKIMSYAKITPTPSRTERPGDRQLERAGERAGERAEWRVGGAASEQGRRRVRDLEVVQRPDVDVQANGNRALMQAALGSFRWPPYLLCVWVLVLVLTHVLHCLVSLLERALPALRRCSQFFRAWTEEAWRACERPQRAYPAALALLTGLCYALYFTLYAVYAVVLWSIEPLASDLDEKRSSMDIESKVTNYDDDLKTNASVKS